MEESQSNENGFRKMDVRHLHRPTDLRWMQLSANRPHATLRNFIETIPIDMNRGAVGDGKGWVTYWTELWVKYLKNRHMMIIYLKIREGVAQRGLLVTVRVDSDTLPVYRHFICHIIHPFKSLLACIYGLRHVALMPRAFNGSHHIIYLHAFISHYYSRPIGLNSSYMYYKTTIEAKGLTGRWGYGSKSESMRKCWSGGWYTGHSIE